MTEPHSDQSVPSDPWAMCPDCKRLAAALRELVNRVGPDSPPLVAAAQDRALDLLRFFPEDEGA